MKLLRRIIAYFTAPCCVVELPAALPNGKAIAITVDSTGAITTVQECPNCEGAGFLSRPSVFSSIDPAAPAVNLPCNRCDCTGEIRG